MRASVKHATKFTPRYFHLVQAVVSSAASTTKEQAYEALPDKKIGITSAEQLDGRGAAVLALPPLPCRCCPLHGIGDNAPDLLGVVSRDGFVSEAECSGNSFVRATIRELATRNETKLGPTSWKRRC